MEILHALRGLGMSGPRTSKGLELDGNRGEVIQPMDKSKKPPRAPNGNKRIKKSHSLGTESSDLHFPPVSNSGSRAASPSPSVKSNRSSISLRLFGRRQRSTSPSPSVASAASETCSTRLSRPPRMLASRQPDLPTNSEIGFGFADRIGATRETVSRRSGARGDARSVASLSSTSSSYYYGAPPAPPRFPSPAASRNSMSLSISEWSPSSTSFPVREFRPELYLDPNQGQSVGWKKCIGGFCTVPFASRFVT